MYANNCFADKSVSNTPTPPPMDVEKSVKLTEAVEERPGSVEEEVPSIPTPVQDCQTPDTTSEAIPSLLPNISTIVEKEKRPATPKGLPFSEHKNVEQVKSKHMNIYSLPGVVM